MEINDILDPDSIVNGNFEVVLFTDGVETHSQALTIGLVDNVMSFATDGTDGSDYQIIVRSTADFLDGVGPIVEHVHYTRVVIYSN